MKRILITGANSYIGTSFEKWMSQYPDQYKVDTVDMVDGSWREKDFSQYDVVFHVAGIAHIKETKQNRHLYYEVNRDLAVETAKKAKAEGVRQFVFLSTMSVYGLISGQINEHTKLNPQNNYGKSKLLAELELNKLHDETFIIAILRPPMVYGEGCKGNYLFLSKVARKLPFFPDFQNQRSMIYIDNLSEYIRFVIEQRKSGLGFPQNSTYICTSEMIIEIANSHRKYIKLIKIFNPIIRLCRKKISIIEKVFGNLIYDREMDKDFDNIISMLDFSSTIKKTELE